MTHHYQSTRILSNDDSSSGYVHWQCLRMCVCLWCVSVWLQKLYGVYNKSLLHDHTTIPIPHADHFAEFNCIRLQLLSALRIGHHTPQKNMFNVWINMLALTQLQWLHISSALLSFSNNSKWYEEKNQRLFWNCFPFAKMLSF